MRCFAFLLFVLLCVVLGQLLMWFRIILLVLQLLTRVTRQTKCDEFCSSQSKIISIFYLAQLHAYIVAMKDGRVYEIKPWVASCEISTIFDKCNLYFPLPFTGFTHQDSQISDVYFEYLEDESYLYECHLGKLSFERWSTEVVKKFFTKDFRYVQLPNLSDVFTLNKSMNNQIMLR